MIYTVQKNDSAMPPIEMIILHVGLFLMGVAIAIYFTLVIYSFVCELREEEESKHKYLKNVPLPTKNPGEIP